MVRVAEEVNVCLGLMARETDRSGGSRGFGPRVYGWAGVGTRRITPVATTF